MSLSHNFTTKATGSLEMSVTTHPTSQRRTPTSH